jgi:hypothetical protein
MGRGANDTSASKGKVIRRACLLFAMCLVPLAFAAAAVGWCRQKRLTIHGSISYQGKPLTAGVIRFHGPDDHVSVATIKPDGCFVITDVLSGTITVTVEPDLTAARHKSMSGEVPNLGPAVIPMKYRSVQTSDLICTIPTKTKHLQLTLQDDSP